jgi:hypothetical protein
MQKKS